MQLALCDLQADKHQQHEPEPKRNDSYLRRHASKLPELLSQDAEHQLIGFATRRGDIATDMLPHCPTILGSMLCQGLQ